MFPLNIATRNNHLDMVFKYATHDHPSCLHVLKIVGNSGQANAYSRDCTGEGIPRRNRKSPGLRCVGCHAAWDKRSDRLKKKIKERATLYLAVQRVMFVPVLTDEDIKQCSAFVKTGDTDLNERGVVLKDKALALISFYKEAKVRALHLCLFQQHFKLVAASLRLSNHALSSNPRVE